MSAPADSVVLEEEIDENYEPTQDEITEYATWLGMVCAQPQQRTRLSSTVSTGIHVHEHSLNGARCRTWRMIRSSSGSLEKG